MDLIPRIQGIILKPKDEWEKIKAEKTTVQQLFTSYAIFVAAIPAVAQFIGRGLIGYRVPVIGWVRFGIGNALIYAILSYVTTLAAVYVMGLIINALAPNFGSKQNLENAMKLVVYSWTPAWIAGVLHIIPMLAILAAVASIYSIYVLYLGMSAGLMETPQDRIVPYMLVSFIAAVVISIVIAVILGSIFAVGAVTSIY